MVKKSILISFTVLFIIAGLVISYPYLYTMFSKFDDGQCLKNLKTGKIYQITCKRTSKKIYFAFEPEGDRNVLEALYAPEAEDVKLFREVNCKPN